jgi:hypothetical protein
MQVYMFIHIDTQKYVYNEQISSIYILGDNSEGYKNSSSKHIENIVL